MRGSIVGSPQIGIPSTSIGASLLAITLTTGALDFGTVPEFDCFSSNPEIICLTDLGDSDTMTGIFSNCNADFVLESVPLSLVGRTDPGIGPVQQITVVPPLVLENNTLYLDMTLITTMGESLDQIAQNEISDTASLGFEIASLEATEAADIAAVQLKEANDIAYIEESIATLSSSLTASFSAQITSLQQQILFLMQQASVGKGAHNLNIGSLVFGTPATTTTGPISLAVGSPVFALLPTLQSTGPTWFATGSPVIGLPALTTTGPVSISTGSPQITVSYLTRYLYPQRSYVLGADGISIGSPEIGTSLITGLNVEKQQWPEFTQFAGGNVQTGLSGTTSVTNLNVPAGALVLLATVSGDGSKTTGADEGSFIDTSDNVYEFVCSNYTPYYGTTSIFCAVLTEPIVNGSITYSATSNCAFGGGFFTGSQLSPLDIATVSTAGSSGPFGLPPKSVKSGIPTEAQEAFFAVCSFTGSSAKINEIALPPGWSTACMSTSASIEGFLYGLIVGYITNNSVSVETFTPDYGGSINAAMCIAGFKKS